MESFNLSSSDQSVQLEQGLKKDFYKTLYESSKLYRGFQFSGPIVGIASGSLSLAMKICLIAENFFKGLINIFGAPFCEKCSFSKGCNQLFVLVPTHLLTLPLSLFSAIKGIVIKTKGISQGPSDYFYKKWCQYDPEINEKSQKTSPEALQEKARGVDERDKSQVIEVDDAIKPIAPHAETLATYINASEEILNYLKESEEWIESRRALIAAQRLAIPLDSPLAGIKQAKIAVEKAVQLNKESRLLFQEDSSFDIEQEESDPEISERLKVLEDLDSIIQEVLDSIIKK